MKLVPFSTLLSYNCLLSYHVSGSINGFLAPCWHWYRCCDKAVVTSCILKSRGGNIPTRSRTSKSSRWKASSNGNILGDTFCRGDHFINQASNHNRFHHLSQGAVEGDWSWVPLNVGGFLRHSRERRVSGCITVWEFEFVTDFLIDPPEGVSQKEIVRFVFVHVILCRKTMTILSCPSKSS